MYLILTLSVLLETTLQPFRTYFLFVRNIWFLFLLCSVLVVVKVVMIDMPLSLQRSKTLKRPCDLLMTKGFTISVRVGISVYFRFRVRMIFKTKLLFKGVCFLQIKQEWPVLQIWWKPQVHYGGELGPEPTQWTTSGVSSRSCAGGFEWRGVGVCVSPYEPYGSREKSWKSPSWDPRVSFRKQTKHLFVYFYFEGKKKLPTTDPTTNDFQTHRHRQRILVSLQTT